MKKASIVVLAALLMAGCASSSSTIIKDGAFIEYGASFQDAMQQIILDDIDLNKIGEVGNFYSLEIGNRELSINYNGKVYKKEVEVRDTKFPDIKLKSNEVVVKRGKEYKLEDNIVKVSDVIDGEIKYKDIDTKNIEDSFVVKLGDKDSERLGVQYAVVKSLEDSKAHLNTYTYSTDFEDQLGKYVCRLYAFDKNGNITIKAFMIEVSDADEDEIEDKNRIEAQRTEERDLEVKVDTDSLFDDLSTTDSSGSDSIIKDMPTLGSSSSTDSESVRRIRRETESFVIPFDNEDIADSNLDEGVIEVRQNGVNGVGEIIIVIELIDEVEISSYVESSKVLIPPVSQFTYHGTKRAKE